MASTNPELFLSSILKVIQCGALEDRYTCLVFLRNLLNTDTFISHVLKNEITSLCTVLISCLVEKSPVSAVGAQCFSNLCLVLRKNNVFLIEILAREVLFRYLADSEASLRSRKSSITSAHDTNKSPDNLSAIQTLKNEMRTKIGEISLPVTTTLVTHISGILDDPKVHYPLFKGLFSALILYCYTAGACSRTISLFMDSLNPLLPLDYQVCVVDALCATFKKVPNCFSQGVSIFYQKLSNILAYLLKSEFEISKESNKVAPNTCISTQEPENKISGESSIDQRTDPVLDKEASMYRKKVINSVILCLCALASEFPLFSSLASIQNAVFSCFIFNEEFLTINALEFFTVLAEAEQKHCITLVSNNNQLVLKLFSYLKPDDSPSWTVHKASVACLTAIGSITNLLLNDDILTFISSKIQSEDSIAFQEGVLALGALCAFPFFSEDCYYDFSFYKPLGVYSKKVCKVLRTSITKLLTVLPSVDSLISERVFWCLSRIFETNSGCFDVYSDAQKLVYVCSKFLKQCSDESLGGCILLTSYFDSSRNLISAECFERGFVQPQYVNNFSENLKETKSENNTRADETIHVSDRQRIGSHLKNRKTVVSPFFFDLSGLLVSLLDSGAPSKDLRLALSDALCSLIEASNTSNELDIVEKIADWHLRRLGPLVSNLIGNPTTNQPGKSNNDNEDAAPDANLNIEDSIGVCLKVTAAAYTRLGERRFGSRRHSLFKTLATILQIEKIGSAHSDAYQTLSSLCTPNSFFAMHCDELIPSMISHIIINDPTITKSCISFVSDVSKSLQAGLLPFSQKIIPALFKTLTNKQTEKRIKPLILNTLSDIALALGRSFEIHAVECFNLLQHVCTLNDLDMDYKNCLDISACELGSGMFLGMGRCEVTVFGLQPISMFIAKTVSKAMSMEVLNACIKLMGDILATMGVCQSTEWIHNLLKKYASDQAFKDVALEALDGL